MGNLFCGCMSRTLFLSRRRTLGYGGVTVVELEQLVFDVCFEVDFQLVFLYHALLLGLDQPHFIKLLSKTNIKL